MEISYLGHASFKLKGKNATVVVDPFDPKIGLKFPKVEADIVASTHSHFDHNAISSVGGSPYVIEGPGEYEVKGIEIVGVASWHDNKEGAERGKNTIYNFKIDKINIAHLGDLGQTTLTEPQVEEIGNVDVLLLPVGGFFTIDASEANKIASQLEPKIIIPMHFKGDSTVSELADVDKFLKEIGKENIEAVPKLVVTPDKLPEETQVVLLSRS
ncbi:MAG TPA: MBL fold metallo-hydrolase [Candidatus Saccharimonadales bacterium]|nr:MBL fold metallo-hydrolase [Candidatus Saccharimonadales bacterium]